MKCPIHPKYKGKKEPKLPKSGKIHPDCICLKIYLKMKNAPRMPHKPTKQHKDKSKIIPRKKKHKNSED